MEKQLEAFKSVKWAELSQEEVVDHVNSFPEHLLDHLIENGEKIDIPELVRRAIYAIRQVEFPGDDYTEPEDKMMAQMESALIQPPAKKKKVTKKMKIHESKSKEESVVFGKNLQIRPDQKFVRSGPKLNYYIKIGGFSSANSKKPFVTLEVGQVLYFWGFTFPFVALGFSSSAASDNWKVIARPLSNKERTDMGTQLKEIFQHPNKKAGANLRKGSKPTIKSAIENVIYIVSGVLEEVARDQQQSLLEIIPKSQVVSPKKKHAPQSQAGKARIEISDISSDTEPDADAFTANQVILHMIFTSFWPFPVI